MEDSFNIPDDAYVFSFKTNVCLDDEDGHESAIAELNWIEDQCGRDNVLYTCIGKHINGENKVPHHHFTIITSCPPRFSDKTKSTSKTRFCAQTETPLELIGTSKVKKINLLKPKFEPLAYPLKEGFGYWPNKDLYKNISFAQYEALTKLGNDLYLTKLGEHERKEKCELRKKSAYEKYKLYAQDHPASSLRGALIVGTDYLLTLVEEEQPSTCNLIEYVKKYALNNKLKTLEDLVRI